MYCCLFLTTLIETTKQNEDGQNGEHEFLFPPIQNITCRLKLVLFLLPPIVVWFEEV